jgi:hypothetical protein
MFGFRRKKRAKGFEKGNNFLKSFAMKIDALTIYTDANESVTKKLRQLKMNFTFTVSPDDNRDMKGNEDVIRSLYEELKSLLSRSDWKEEDVLLLIDRINAELEAVSEMVC